MTDNMFAAAIKKNTPALKRIGLSDLKPKWLEILHRIASGDRSIDSGTGIKANTVAAMHSRGLVHWTNVGWSVLTLMDTGEDAVRICFPEIDQKAVALRVAARYSVVYVNMSQDPRLRFMDCVYEEAVVRAAQITETNDLDVEDTFELLNSFLRKIGSNSLPDGTDMRTGRIRVTFLGYQESSMEKTDEND